MSFYVRISPINGRRDQLSLSRYLLKHGYKTVEYCQGGWMDTSVGNIAPHLKFEDESDAVAFVIARGGEYCKEPPVIRFVTAVD